MAMGISLQMYRMTIGCFVNNLCRLAGGRRHYLDSEKKNDDSKLTILKLLLFMMIFTMMFLNGVIVLNSGSKIYDIQDCSRNLSITRDRTLDHNFLARYKYGNKSKNGLKLSHINMGGGYLLNRMNEVESVISEEKPHVLGISEASIHSEHDLKDLKIDNYTLQHSLTLQNPSLNVSRVCVLVHDSVVSKIRYDLMNDVFSSVWIELGFPRQKKILLSNIYREWQYLLQRDNSSKSKTAQLLRWSSFLDQWEQAISEDKEIIVMGDMNINFLNWPSHMQPDNSDDLSSQLLNRIYPYGFLQLVQEPTRFWPGHTPSGIDHIYTNNPDKIANLATSCSVSSDHKLISVIRM